VKNAKLMKYVGPGTEAINRDIDRLNGEATPPSPSVGAEDAWDCAKEIADLILKVSGQLIIGDEMRNGMIAAINRFTDAKVAEALTADNIRATQFADRCNELRAGLTAANKREDELERVLRYLDDIGGLGHSIHELIRQTLATHGKGKGAE